VVGSNVTVVGEDGRTVRGREYPWGTVNVESKEHCDFSLLQKLLWGHNTQHLIDYTHQVHYENFRFGRLGGEQGSLKVDNRDIAEQDKKLTRMEEEMTELFQKKVVDRLEQQKHNSAEIERVLRRELAEVEAAKEDIRVRREQFIKEKKIWEKERSSSMGNILSAGCEDTEDTALPEVPKSWGFLTLRRSKKTK